MASIGSITNVEMQGIVHTPRAMATQYIRDGLAGSGFTTTAAHGIESKLITHHPLNDVPLGATAKEQYAILRDIAYAIIGTVVTVVDAFGETFNNVVVMTCQVGQAYAATGGADLYCSIEWTIIAEENTP